MVVLLVMKSRDGHERVFRLRRGTSVIGRSHVCDLRITLPTVAMRHCEITWEQNGPASLRSVAAGLPTMVNGSPVEAAALSEGDIIQIGPVQFAVRFDHSVMPPVSDRQTIEIKSPSPSSRTIAPPAHVTPRNETTDEHR